MTRSRLKHRVKFSKAYINVPGIDLVAKAVAKVFDAIFVQFDVKGEMIDVLVYWMYLFLV